MHPAEHLECVRRRIRETFHELGADASEPLHETLLIRDGYYCGRRFQCDGLQATWFVEENELKFHGRDGRVERVCDDVWHFAATQQRVA